MNERVFGVDVVDFALGEDFGTTDCLLSGFCLVTGLETVGEGFG
jgi:hypothetical protein